MKNYPLHSKTATMIDGARAAAPRRAAAAGAAARWDLLRAALLVVASFLATWLLRAVYLERSFDVFYDELIYTHISQNVARGAGVKYYTAPFFLHPPLFFLLQGAYLRLPHPAGTIIDQVYATRYFDIGFAALSAALLFLIGRRVAGNWAGALAVGVFALDPFVIRINSRNLLETHAMFWVLLGYYILMRAIPVGARSPTLLPAAVGEGGKVDRDTYSDPYKTRPLPLITQALPAIDVDAEQAAGSARPGAARLGARGWLVVIGAGCAFGLAILSKEPVAVLILLPLAICFVTGWSLPRWASALVGTVALLTYLVYPLWVWGFGDWGQFQQQKLRGVFRFAGVVQESGFNQHGGPSFAQAILSNLGQFATTYALIGSGLVAIVVLFLLGGRLPRLLAIWTAGAYALKGFLVLFGTNEEQYFYYLVVSSILATAAAAVLLLRAAARSAATYRRLRAAIAVAVALFAAWTGSIWVRQHFTPDNGYERLYAYLRQNVPAGSRIATTTNPSSELLKSSDYEIGSWGTVADVCENEAQYVVISTLLVEKRYDAGTPELYDWLVARAQPIFVFSGPTDGNLLLYRVDLATCAAQGGQASSATTRIARLEWSRGLNGRPTTNEARSVLRPSPSVNGPVGLARPTGGSAAQAEGARS